jgi:hypothetical protein
VIESLHRDYPNDPEVSVLEARLALLRGDSTAAQFSLEHAAQKGLPAERIEQLRTELQLAPN